MWTWRSGTASTRRCGSRVDHRRRYSRRRRARDVQHRPRCSERPTSPPASPPPHPENAKESEARPNGLPPSFAFIGASRSTPPASSSLAFDRRPRGGRSSAPPDEPGEWSAHASTPPRPNRAKRNADMRNALPRGRPAPSPRIRRCRRAVRQIQPHRCRNTDADGSRHVSGTPASEARNRQSNHRGNTVMSDKRPDGETVKNPSRPSLQVKIPSPAPDSRPGGHSTRDRLGEARPLRRGEPLQLRSPPHCCGFRMLQFRSRPGCRIPMPAS